MAFYAELLQFLEAVADRLEGAPEATGDAEALLRVQVAEAIATARRVAAALAADEDRG